MKHLDTPHEVTVVTPAPAPAPAAQRFWFPGRLPGLNEIIAAAKGAGGRGYLYSKMKAKLTSDVVLLARTQRLRPVPRAYFRFTWYERDRLRNPDNIAGGRKFIFDGLVKAGILANDGWGQVAGWSDRFEVSPDPGVVVEIEEVGADVGCSSPRRRR